LVNYFEKQQLLHSPLDEFKLPQLVNELFSLLEEQHHELAEHLILALLPVLAEAHLLLPTLFGHNKFTKAIAMLGQTLQAKIGEGAGDLCETHHEMISDNLLAL
jgi:hypothetical protein